MKSDNTKAWGIVSPRFGLYPLAFWSRKEAMKAATEGCMGFREYERLPNTSARWRNCYNRGYRLVRVTISREFPNEG